MNQYDHFKDGTALPAAKEERRKFLAVTAKIAGVLAALGVTGEVFSSRANAADEENKKHKALRELLQEAVKSKDVKEAIEKHGKDAELTGEQEKALLELTKEDLTAIGDINKKLRPLAEGRAKGDTNGYVVF
jgi:hypothetical protein